MSERFLLAIVKGIPPVPGDTGSLERVDDVLDLLNVEGFSVSDKGWVPKLPQVKNGGVYIDNPNIADRFPLALTLGHVQETLTLSVSGSSFVGRYWLESRLVKLAKAARDFWLTEWQQQPVYLMWQAPDAKGPQYARIYNMDIAPTKDILQIANVGQIVITVDREHGWLLIPPGANPKWASYIVAGNEAGFNSSTASLYSGTDHAAYGTIYNRQEFNTLYTFLTTNYIDVPASKIPGDLPALACIDVEVEDGVGTYDVYIAKSTKPTTVSDRAANSHPLYNVLAASGGSMQNLTALVADAARGIVHTPASATAKVANPNFATTTEVLRIMWTVGAGLYPHLSPTILRGTYNVYVRADQVNGAAGICNMRLTMQSTGDFVFFNSGPVKVQLRSTGHSGLHYMGMVTIGADVASQISARGTGRQAEYDFTVYLYAQRTTATGAAVLNIVDVVFIPVEEGAIQIKPDYYDHVSTHPLQHIYDNTGYFTHGKPEDIATVHGVPGGSNDEYSPLVEPLGSQILLEPGVNNRLYFLCMTRGTDPPQAGGQLKMDVFVNIIPRWAGVRDV